jgi:uncharacterized repeat protein (TIGR01451 family)
MRSLKSRAVAGIALLAVAGGLLVFGSAAPGLTQTGANNYIGPGPCPAGYTCQIVPPGQDVEGAEQTTLAGGKNIFICSGLTCTVNQHGTAGQLPPDNEATCDNSVGVSAEQRCQVDQNGKANKITATHHATLNNNQLADIQQTSEQRFLTNQTGDTNELVVNGTISQTATGIVDLGNTPVAIEQTQHTLQYSENNLTATTRNTVRYNLRRSQSATANALHPTQRQDETPADTFGTQTLGSNGRAEIRLNANSSAVNDIDVTSTDLKNQQATSLDLQPVTQKQGYETGQDQCFGSTITKGGGILGCILVDSGVQNPDGDKIDLDVGSPDGSGPDPSNFNDSTTGLVKAWTQHAVGGGGVPITASQDQSDKIPLIPIGSSPFTTQNLGRALLVNDANAHMLCDASADGHSKTIWRGRLFCSLSEGGQDPIIVDVPYQGQTIHASIRCERNQDLCPEGTVLPAGEASMDVRNMNESYDGDGATSVEQGQDFVYASTFRNTGPTDSVARNATLTVPIPANTTFVACPEGCPGQPSGGSVTWNLGDVAGGQEVTKQLQLKVNADAPVGDITNVATGSHDGANAGDPRVTFDSNTTTVTVTEKPPVPPREITINILEDTLNVTNPKAGKATVQMFDKTIVPNTVCFGDLAEGQCTGGTNPTLGSNYLQMKFLVRDTGLDLGDTTACLTAQTTSGETVHGCDTIKTV